LKIKRNQLIFKNSKYGMESLTDHNSLKKEVMRIGFLIGSLMRTGYPESRIFQDNADRDYIMARIAYFYGFDYHFLWNSYQSIEKYLKSILLYNGEEISKEKRRHNVVILYDKVKEKIHRNFDISPIVGIFITDLERECNQGHIRYLTRSYCSNNFYNSPLINVLDEVIWSIRKLCQKSGYLEKILNANARSDYSKIRDWLLLKNPKYGTESFKGYKSATMFSPIDENGGKVREALKRLGVKI